MKFRLFILLLTACFFTSATNVNAAFIVKKSQSSETAKTATTPPKSERAANRRALMNNLRTATNLAHHNGLNGSAPHGDTSGWEGIVALCCGILGLFTFFPAIPAIIFGAIGMGRGKAHRGMATAGLVLGILTIVLVLFFILLFASFWWMF